MDRGVDRINLFGPILERQCRFLFRLVGNRNLVFDRKTMLAEEVALWCPCPFRKSIARIEDVKEVNCVLRFAHRRVRLPERPEPLSLLVIHGLGKEPLMLLTNEPVTRSYKSLWRVLNYRGLQNLMPLVLAAKFFAACVPDHNARLRVMAGCVDSRASRDSACRTSGTAPWQTACAPSSAGTPDRPWRGLPTAPRIR